MGILKVATLQPVGGGTTITLNSSEINVGAGITFESNGQAITQVSSQQHHLGVMVHN